MHKLIVKRCACQHCNGNTRVLIIMLSICLSALITLPAVHCNAVIEAGTVTGIQDEYCLVTMGNKELRKPIGSVWLSPTNPCNIYACEINVNTGRAYQIVRTEDCSQFHCDVDAEIRNKTGTCCGTCVRTKCHSNNTVYDVGQTWHNDEACTLLECVQLANGTPMINAYQKTCPPMPPDCELENIHTVNCCPICKNSVHSRLTDELNIELDDENYNEIWTKEFYQNHPCVRECQLNQTPKTCHYTFVVEWYETLSKACFDCPVNQTDCNRPHCIFADGIRRSITVVNRMMPGPSIEVCENDIIVVDVKNNLLGESTTIHWHGLHQKDSPYMDGVPHISQCPISPHSTFRYTFPADNAGTHFWHSHTGMQRGDGVFGTLIIHRPRSTDPHAHLYDFDLMEHRMIVQDWVHVPGTSMFASHHHSRGDNKPLNLLLNGKGRYYKAIWNELKNNANINANNTNKIALTMPTTSKAMPSINDTKNQDIYTTQNVSDDKEVINSVELLNNTSKNNTIIRLSRVVQTDLNKNATNENIQIAPINEYLNRTKRFVDQNVPLQAIPHEIFTVQQGFRYRFRLINAEFLNCPIQVSIDNHTLLAISSDGYDLEPVEVGSIITYAGERFDFIVNANKTIGNYWIRLKGLMDCSEKFTSAFQVGILRYDTALDEEPKATLGYHHQADGIELNSINQGSGHPNAYTIAELNALQAYDSVPGVDRDALKPIADYKFFVYYDFYRKDNPVFHPADYYGIDANISNENRVFTPQLNHISLKFPSMALLPSRNDVDDSMFCNETSLAAKGIDCRNEFCKCHHVLQVPLNSIVELIIVDEGFQYDANHPFHLHGNAFRVVGLERLGSNVTIEMIKQLDRYNLLKRNLVRPPVKDTVTVPDGGYTILRFEAYNPGFWLFHCHIEFHAEIGMAFIIKVGNNNEMAAVPKNFPQCHDYIPNSMDNDDSDDNVMNPTTEDTTKGGANAKSFYISYILISFIPLMQF